MSGLKKPGVIFRVDFPEYHVECACGASIFVSQGDTCFSVRDAEKCLRSGNTEDDSIGWRKIDGAWRCPKCAGPDDGRTRSRKGKNANPQPVPAKEDVETEDLEGHLEILRKDREQVPQIFEDSPSSGSAVQGEA